MAPCMKHGATCSVFALDNLGCVSLVLNVRATPRLSARFACYVIEYSLSVDNLFVFIAPMTDTDIVVQVVSTWSGSMRVMLKCPR